LLSEYPSVPYENAPALNDPVTVPVAIKNGDVTDVLKVGLSTIEIVPIAVIGAVVDTVAPILVTKFVFVEPVLIPTLWTVPNPGSIFHDGSALGPLEINAYPALAGGSKTFQFPTPRYKMLPCVDPNATSKRADTDVGCDTAVPVVGLPMR
jgi:hypothetical protein